MARLVAVTGASALLLTGLSATASPASATTTISSRYMLNHLDSGREHTSGYDRSKFAHWTDADRDGCNARYEVLIAEAQIRPRLRAGCALSGGRWRSVYDGLLTTDPSSFDVDHMVPLNEAWQSGAWRWSPATRRAYANDLGYKESLIAVSASSNRSKSDQEPQTWMPHRSAYSCTYVKRWVAVKWRWRLKVNAAERSYLAAKLKSCGWPRVSKPTRPRITTGSDDSGGSASSGGSGSGSGSTGGGGGLDPRFAYCYQANDAGYGPYVRGVDPEYDWYDDRDGDGIVCET